MHPACNCTCPRRTLRARCAISSSARAGRASAPPASGDAARTSTSTSSLHAPPLFATSHFLSTRLHPNLRRPTRQLPSHALHAWGPWRAAQPCGPARAADSCLARLLRLSRLSRLSRPAARRRRSALAEALHALRALTSPYSVEAEPPQPPRRNARGSNACGGNARGGAGVTSELSSDPRIRLRPDARTFRPQAEPAFRQGAVLGCRCQGCPRPLVTNALGPWAAMHRCTTYTQKKRAGRPIPYPTALEAARLFDEPRRSASCRWRSV